MVTYEQDPAEAQDYQESVTGDTVSAASWTISPTGPTVGVPTNTSTTSTVRVSGVGASVLYTLSCVLTGASGKIYKRSCYIRGTVL